MANILVTGANGFIGSHIVNRLKGRHRVVSLVHNEVSGQWLNEALDGTIRAPCDIRDAAALRSIIARFQINMVYHSAALAIVKTAYRDPIGVYGVNTMGTVALLEACRLNDVEKMLVLNTDKVYGEGLNSDEDSPYTHGEPYATSKSCQGLIVRSFSDTYDMNIVMTHSCNVFGYDPYSDRIVSNVVKACLEGRSPLIFTNDRSLREYVFVEDVVGAFESLMNDDSKRGPYNVCTGWLYNQEAVVLRILERFPGIQAKYVEGTIPKQVREQSLKSNRWEWTPSWTMDDAIGATIEKFRQYRTDWSRL